MQVSKRNPVKKRKLPLMPDAWWSRGYLWENLARFFAQEAKRGKSPGAEKIRLVIKATGSPEKVARMIRTGHDFNLKTNKWYKVYRVRGKG